MGKHGLFGRAASRPGSTTWRIGNLPREAVFGTKRGRESRVNCNCKAVAKQPHGHCAIVSCKHSYLFYFRNGTVIYSVCLWCCCYAAFDALATLGALLTPAAPQLYGH